MNKLAVFGNPIKHSLSPKIHQHFASQFNINLSYEKILADNFTASVDDFILSGGIGCNVTIPFKVDAYNFVTQLNDNAKQAKAVNTIKIFNKNIIGYNTDGIGIVNDLLNNIRVNLQDKVILILGAGGAARGIIPEILKNNPERLMIANRTASKALDLATEFSTLGKTCGFSLEKVKHSPVDIVINATSSSLDNQVPKIANGCIKGAICYDLAYGKQTSFMDFAKKNNAKFVTNGWGMLVEQAAKSFEIWFDKKPNTQFLINNQL